MRIVIGVLLLFCCIFTGVAQELRSIEWFRTSERDSSVRFEGAIQPTAGGLPVYSETYRPLEESGHYSVSVSFPMLEPLTAEEETILKPLLNTIPDTLSYTYNLGWERKKPVIDLVLNPFVRKGRTYYKLVSFRWSIRPASTTSGVSLRATRNYVSSSVLSAGKWKKISVTASGMYKLTYEDLVKMGINPEKAQVYGYGGKMLGEDFRTTVYTDDLPEVPVWKDTGKDGIFNAGDCLLFYAQGPVYWYQSGNLITRLNNPYSNKAYYFIGERAGGSLIAERRHYTQEPTRTVNSYTHIELYEKDLVNMGESVAGDGTGRELYGEDLVAVPSRSFSFAIPDVDTTQFATLAVEAAAYNTGSSYTFVKVNGTPVVTLTMPGVPSGPDNFIYGTSSVKTGKFRPASDVISVQLDYAKNGNSSTPRAFLNYILLNVRRLLKDPGKSFSFRDPLSVESGGVAQFVIQNASASTLVFDVTTPGSMTLMEGSLDASAFTFVAPATTLREYACVNMSGTIPKPTIEGSVPNQNLHAYQPDMVILTPPEFEDQAKRLAQAHRENDNLSVLVVTPEQVYNEFSSGTPDATAYRRMMKLYYDRATTEEEMPDYLLLFGGGIYDNRLNTAILRGSAKSNRLLTYQSIETLDGTHSYTSDDYFGFLDDTEGFDLSMAKLDLGIGRFPVQTQEQARNTVEKTIRYMKNDKRGTWKNRVLFLADDGDVTNENIHMRQAESLASTIDNSYPQYMANRLYVDAYKKIASTTGVTIPDGNKRFAELLDMGLLMLNYIGHSSMTEWAEEKILTQALARSMTNTCLPLWITASCDFTRYDTPDESGGETAFFNPIGGAIGLFSTTRIVYSENNFNLNKRFIEYIFQRRDSRMKTLGNIMRQAKSSEFLSVDRNKLSFTLIGDPALKLANPQYETLITSVNGRPVSTVIDTFKALQQITVEGEIRNEEGVLASGFNGVVHPTVLDASTLVKTLGSNGADIMSFYDKSRVLLSVKDSVINGRFRFTFVIPKDIQYSFRQGRINLYACDNEQEHEANGVFDRFALGGTSAVSSPDTVGPVVRLYLNDSTFVSGDAVNEAPTMIARLFDESGLNGSENSVGHDYRLVIDNDPERVYSLNGYFMADIGSFQSGTVQFVLPELSPGKHTLSFRAWDVMNNSSTQTVECVVKKNLSPRVYDLVAVRQSDGYRFSFRHDRPDVPLSVTCEVVDMMGRVWWRHTQSMQTGETQSEVMTWNFYGNNDKRAPAGIYACRIWVTDETGGKTSISEKIQVLPQ